MLASKVRSMAALDWLLALLITAELRASWKLLLCDVHCISPLFFTAVAEERRACYSPAVQLCCEDIANTLYKLSHTVYYCVIFLCWGKWNWLSNTWLDGRSLIAYYCICMLLIVFRRTCVVLLFILMFLCSVTSTCRVANSDDVVANCSFCLFSQQIIDTVHKPLPRHHLVRGQMTWHTLAQCSWTAFHLMQEMYIHLTTLVLLSGQFWSYETSVKQLRISKKYICSIF